jgi:hypothetical protein
VTQPGEAPELSYATPEPAPASALTAAVWMAIVGLGLVVLGGCFLIGVLVSWHVSSDMFVATLYGCAAVCFAAAAWALFAGLGRLWMIARRSGR